MNRSMVWAAAILGLGSFAVEAKDVQISPGEIPDPINVTAENGVLDITLTAKPAAITVAGRTLTSNVYNGMYIPPLLRLKRGDELRLTLINEIGPGELGVDQPQATNMHYHGMTIPPVQPADDIYMLVPPLDMRLGKHIAHGKGMDIKDSNTFEYRWRVPEEHALGVFWYHPHPHGQTEMQVLNGLSGMLVIDGLVDTHYPELAGLKRRSLIFKDIELPNADDDDAKTKTVNGVLGGVMHTTPGSFEVWELGNLGADSYVDLALDGHRFWVIDRDGNALVAPQLTDHVFLPPSSRAQIVVEAGAAGSYALRSREVDTGEDGDPNPDVVLATLQVAGAMVDAPEIRRRLSEPAAAIGEIPFTPEKIAGLPVTGTRKIVYTENEEEEKFFLNGKTFEVDRIDVDVKLGDVEEWTLINDSDERHTFHIHQTEFLVQSVGDNPLETAGVRDNVDLPFRDPKTGKPGVVKVKIPFTNPLIVGKFPFHCHILEHEDGGMMMNLRVRSP